MDAMTISRTLQHLQAEVLPSSSPSDDNEIDIMDLGEFQHLFEHKNFQAVLEVLSEHESYMNSFLKAHSALLHGDVPLSLPLRHFVAMISASQHSCHPLVSYHRSEFVSAGGPVEWLDAGLPGASTKLQKLGKINQILAHQPWTIQPNHIEEITRSGSKDNWSLSELVYAIVLMAHFHSFSSFIESCVSVEDGSKSQQNLSSSPINTKPVPNVNTTRPYDCTSPSKGSLERTSSKEKRHRKGSMDSRQASVESCCAAEESAVPYDCSAPAKNCGSGSPVSDLVDSLVQKMEQLRSQPEADSD